MRTCQYRVEKCLALCIAGALMVGFAPRVAGELVVESGDYRRQHSLDPGTLRVFVRNKGDEPVKVTRVVWDDVPAPVFGVEYPFKRVSVEEFEKLPIYEKAKIQHSNKRAMWAYFEPQPVPAHGLSTLQIKLFQEMRFLARLKLVAGEQELAVKAGPESNPFGITFIGLSPELDTLYIYLANSSRQSLSVKQVQVNGEDVTDRTRKLSCPLPPGKKGLLIARLEEPLRKGGFFDVRVVADSEEGNTLVAQERIRAFSGFQLGLEWRTPRDNGIGLDTDVSTWSFAKATEVLPEKCPASIAHLFACPMHRCGGPRGSAEVIVRERARFLEAGYPVPSTLHVCRVELALALFLFGELPDAIRFNSGTAREAWVGSPSGTEHGSQALCRLAALAAAPRPYHAVVMASKADVGYSHWLTPEEARLAVFYPLSRGSKAILYRYWQVPKDRQPAKFEAELLRINSEIRQLKPFLAIADQFPVEVETSLPESSKWPEFVTFLAGDKAIILYVLNRDLRFPEKKGEQFEFTPIPAQEISLTVPSWFKARDIRMPDGGSFAELDSEAGPEGRLSFTLPAISTAKAVLIRSKHVKGR